MKTASKPKESVQRAKSTATGPEELHFISKPRTNNPLKAFFSSKFCLCFQTIPENSSLEEEKKANESQSRLSLLPGDFIYPSNGRESLRNTKISEEKSCAFEKKKKFKKQLFSNIMDIWKRYGERKMFFLADRKYENVFLSKICGIELDGKMSRVQSKVTKSFSGEYLEKNCIDNENMKSPLNKVLNYIFKNNKFGVCLLITGKIPEIASLYNFKKSNEFLFILKKSRAHYSQDNLKIMDSNKTSVVEFSNKSIEIISTNFMNSRRVLKTLIFDVVILDFFSNGSLNFFEEFCEIEELLLALDLQIQEALCYSDNLILLIPCINDLSILLPLFSEKVSFFYLYIEVFTVYDQKPEIFAIYYGKKKHVSNEKIVVFLSDYLNKDSSFVKNVPNISHFLWNLSTKLPFKQIFKEIIKAEHKKCCKNETLFQRFLDLLRKQAIISIEEQQEYLLSSHDKLQNNDKFSSFYENCSSAFSFQKPHKKHENKNIFVFKDKTPDFESLTRRTAKNCGKSSKISNYSERNGSFSEYTLENPDNHDCESFESNMIVEFEKKKRIKGIIREKSV